MSIFLGDSPSLDAHFRDAVAAIDAGDVETLNRLLTEHPALPGERLESPGAWLRDTVGDALDGFFKRPYLLWFVAEDPVRKDSAWGGTPLGWAEHYVSEPSDRHPDAQYAEIAAYLGARDR